MSKNQEHKCTKEEIDELIRRGNQVIKKYRIVEELNKIGIRTSDQPRKYIDLAEISAAFGIVEKVLQEKSNKELEKACGYEVSWL